MMNLFEVLDSYVVSSLLYSSFNISKNAPFCIQYQLLKYTRDKKREGMIINVTEWNRRKRRENILMSGGGSPDITTTSEI